MAARTTRQMADEQKQKIRQSMLRYWAGIPAGEDQDSKLFKLSKDETQN